MLFRHLLRYAPSLIVPAATTFVATYSYTRLLSRSDFGDYALCVTSMVLFNAVFFYWLQVALPRLMPAAIKANRSDQLEATAYLSFAVSSALLGLVTALLIWLLPSVFRVLILAPPLSLARSLLNINQSFHRSRMNIARYNVLECTQAIVGLVAGISLVMIYHMGVYGAVLGMVAGLSVAALLDIEIFLMISVNKFDFEYFKEVIYFGLPLVGTFALLTAIPASGQFILEHYRGSAEVGSYMAGYTPIDRIVSLIFNAIVIPAYPLVVNKFEHEGIDAARKQTYSNGVAMIAVALPACVGLALCSTQLAAVLIGPSLRYDAMRVMPVIALASGCGGFAAHYFDHSFHLAKKTYMFFLTEGPTALLAVAANLLLIPKMGFMGAAYVTAASSLLLLILSAGLGRCAFPIMFPFFPAFQVVLSTVIMAAVVEFVTASNDIQALIVKVLSGIAVYSISIAIFNVNGVRSHALKAFNRARVSARGGL